MDENKKDPGTNEEKPDSTLDELKAELERIKAENGKLKAAQSNASADAAKWKKELRESMDAKTRAEAETKELIEQLKAENEAMKRNQGVAERIAAYVGVGFSADLAKKAAEASFDGKFDDFMVTLKAFLTEHDKALAADALRNNPRPGAGGKEPSVTKEQFDKMNYIQRSKLYDENPDLYQELIKK